MDPQSLSGPQLYVFSFLYALASGLIPVVNIEVYLLAVATLTKGAPAPILLLVTAGQMIAKYILYLSGRGLIRLPPGRIQGKVQKARDALESHPRGAGGVVLFSAITGFPPFYGMSLAAGALALPLPRFLVAATFGRLLRFTVVFFAPQLLHLRF
jgi:membrane protein YqaA with SNARE-associated domain